MIHAWTRSLTRSFSGLTAGLGMYMAANTTTLADDKAPADAAPPPSGLVPANAGALSDPVDGRRSLQSGLDDYFAHNYSVHGSHGGLWITPPTRTDVNFVAPAADSFFQVTRQYVQVQPLRWDWLGQASGLGYGIQCNLGPGLDTAHGLWTFKGGGSLNYFQNPDPLKAGDVRADMFLEAGRDIHVYHTPARLLLGTAFSAASGPDLGHGAGTRVYSEVDFPHLFGGKVETGDKALDEYALGRFSGALRASCGTSDYSGQVGFYYNHLEQGGKNASFSIGPDIGYRKNHGMTFGARVQFSPKFW